MATPNPADIADHAFIKALAGLLDVGLKHYLIIGTHNELEHSGTAADCAECGGLFWALPTRGGEERERLYSSMRDFADKYVPATGAVGGPTCMYCRQPMPGKRSDAKVCGSPACKKVHREARAGN